MSRKSARAEEGGLIFEWDDRQPCGFRLLVACLLTFGGLVGMFMIFRVVTPEARPVTTRPQQMIVLNPDVPAERALIHHAMDRSFPLLPTESAALTAIPSAALMPKFRPASAGMELKLKPLPGSVATSSRQHLLSMELDVLPPPPVAVVPSRPAATPQVLRLQVEGDAAARLEPGTPVADIRLVDASRPRFRVAVGRLGQVTLALPVVAVEDAAAMEQLRKAVLALRFRPAEKDVEWAEVGFRWEGRPGA